MVENILQMAMGFVDNYLVAQFSLAAVSGISLANNIITVYQALFIALASAISSLVARSIGQGQAKKQVKFMADAIVLTVLVSLLVGLVSFFFGEKMLYGLGASKAVAEKGTAYLMIVGGAIISLGLMTSLSAIVRAQGRAKIPMQVSVLINVVNAILSASSVYVFGFGVAGVAWSTVISRLFGIVLLSRELPMKEIFSQITWSLDEEMFTLSLPAAGERLMMRLGDVLIVSIIVHFGTRTLAGNAIGETISQFNYMPAMAISTATVILVANSVGEKDFSNLKMLVRDSFIMSTMIMIFVSLAIYLLGPAIIGLFTGDQVASQAAMIVLLFSLLGAPTTAGTLVYTALWQGLGNASLPFYTTCIGMWLIRIVMGYILGIVLNLGLSGVWIATLLDNLVRWMILRIIFRRYEKVTID